MTPVDEALEIMLYSVKPLSDESVDIFESEGRVISEDIISDIDIPIFNNSAMDGYAVISADTEKIPVKLKITGEIQAGITDDRIKVNTGEAVEIMTGAPIPDGADSVVPVENTEESNGIVTVSKKLKVNENVRFAGEDISSGQKVISRGDIISSANTGLLASLNRNSVRVYSRPEVAIISTGDEVVDIGEELKPGQIRNSNAYTLYSEVKKYGAIPVYLGVAGDTPEKTMEMFKKGLKSDLVITTGGVSMGKYDFVKDVMNELGVNINIEKISIKPGKPLVFGMKDQKIFFGLPGNPVSTMISFIQFVRPVILKMMGASRIHKPLVSALLENDIKKKAGRRHYIRGYFTLKNGRFHVSTTGPQGSGILSSMSNANCLIILPEDVESVNAGVEVMIQLINHLEI